MKKYIILLIIAVFNNLAISQSIDYLKGIAKSDTNFFQIKTSGDLYFSQDSILRDGNKFGYKEFLRWSQFYEGRTFNEVGNVGNLKKYYEVMGGYSQNRTTLCSNPLGLNYQWDFLGPKNLSDQFLGMVTSVTFFDDGVNKIIFAGSAAGGIFVTANMGVNWNCITEDLNMPGIGFSDLRVLDDPINNKRYLIAGTGLLHRGYGVGILRLDLLNPNATWIEESGLPQLTGGVLQSYVNQIILHPTDKSKVYALIGNTLYESSDYGDNWNSVFSGSSNHQFSKMIFHPADPNIQYISTYTTANPCSSPPVIWKSNDGGQNWSTMYASFLLPNSARIDIATSSILSNANDPNQDPLYCAFSETIDCQNNVTSANTEIYKYDNGINEFVAYTNILGQDTYITRHCFEISPSNANLIGTVLHPDMYFGSLGFHNISQSNFGAAYRNALNMHDDLRDIEIIPDFSNNGFDHILVGNDGGISLSVDNGQSWTNLNGPGLNITMFQGFDVAESNIDFLLGGTQDNNAYKYDYLNDIWTRFGGGDVYKFQLSEEDGDKYFYSYNGGQFTGVKGYLTNQPSSTFQLVPNNLTQLSGPITLPQYQHPSGTIYFGQKEVGVLTYPCYQSKFISNIYQSEGLNSTLNAIGVCEHQPNVIYIGYGGVEQGNNSNPKKFYKTTNGSDDNPVWVDFTDNLNNSFDTDLTDNFTVFDWIEISDIVVNPTNSQEVWVAFRNISYDFQGNGTMRVIHSINGGNTWNDWSVNLPSVPVNDIEYFNGSDGGIFAATDVGIFYTSNDDYLSNGWSCINENLPVLLVNDIEINYTRKKIVAGTFGRGIYESDLHVNYLYTANTNSPFNCSSTVTTISTNTTISGNQTYCGNLEIKEGVTLTVTGTIFMAPGTEIIIKNSSTTGTPGGRMILNGGTITAKETCWENGRWKGIFVMGDPTKSQSPYFNTQQGMLTVTNGGTICNAEVGAHAGKLNGFTIQNQGGIIITDDANFKNNKKDILLWPYTNYLNNPANPIANRSRFTKTKFQTLNSNALTGLIATDNTQHLVLFGVDGILVRECLFENGRTPSSTNLYEDLSNTAELMSLQEMGIGIYSVNSKFRVTGFCDFFAQQSAAQCDFENEFKNLFYGIKAVSSNPLRSAFIDGNFFNSNYHAVFLNGVDYAYLARNLFTVRNVNANVSMNTPNTAGTDIPYGLHINQCSNYKITENYFNAPTFNTQGPCNNNFIKVAMQISLPDGNPEEVYNNYFTDYHSNVDIDPGVGVLVQGDPNDTDPTDVAKLQILCNDFNGAKMGANAERYTNHIALTENGKVSENQGSPASAQSPAGNRFGLSFVGSSSIHKACVLSDEPFDNCVSFTNDDGEFNTLDGLLPLSGISYYHHSNTLTFPLDVQCGSTDVANSLVPEVYSKSIACPTIINPIPQPHLFRQAIGTYNTSIENELEFIDTDDTQGLLNLIYGNASPGQVKNALMAASPYLSDEVLKAYLYDSPPHGNLKQVVIANSPVTKDVKQIIEGMSLPNGIRNQINAAQTGISERQHLEARVNWFELKKEQNINELVRYHLQRDTVPDYLDSVKQVLTQYNENHNACKLASAFSSQKDFIQALSILDAHLADHPNDALCKLQKLMIEFDQELSWCLNPTQEQKDKLEEIKDDHHKGCIAAKGFLELIEGLPLEDYRILPRTNRSAIRQEETITEKENEKFIAYPSPTANYINFNCYGGEIEFSSIEIYDFTGKIIQTIQPDKSGFAYTDMSSFSNGIYLAVLKSNGLIRGQTKFILNK